MNGRGGSVETSINESYLEQVFTSLPAVGFWILAIFLALLPLIALLGIWYELKKSKQELRRIRIIFDSRIKNKDE